MYHMKKNVIVLSLGGSQIIPDDVNYKYLNEFKDVLLKNKKNYKFIIVCGGGSLARKYIGAIKQAGKNEKFQSFAGITATRTNAKFVNLTDVDGLYTKNPKEFKDAKFIKKITWKDFDNMASKLKFVPGQHFVLDQSASKIILEKK